MFFKEKIEMKSLFFYSTSWTGKQTAANYPAVNPTIWYKADLGGEHVENTYAWFHPRTPESKSLELLLMGTPGCATLLSIAKPWPLCTREKKNSEKTENKPKKSRLVMHLNNQVTTPFFSTQWSLLITLSKDV